MIASEVLVYGATPCGIAAALAAAENGRRVSLVSPARHIGGLMASGLSITDVRFPYAFGGLFKRFTERVRVYYEETYGPESPQVQACNNGLWFEPGVAELIFERMLAESPNVALYRGRRAVAVAVSGGEERKTVRRLEAVDSATGAMETFRADIFIDAGYEGDVAALAGVPYRVGREGREEHEEPYAGFIFLKNPGLQVLEGSTGAGDRLVQAYNYRLCLTNRDDLRVLPEQPDDYDRAVYAPLVGLCREGQLRSLNDVIRLAPIPNGKYNGNNRPIVRSLDLPGANTDYPEGDEAARERIRRTYRSYMTGLLWFVQHDEELSEELRREALQWGFCRDEFADNGHVPYELYVREARRIEGRATFTANDAFLAPGSERAPIHADSVAVGDYHVDSHLVQRQQPGWPQIEGHVYLRALSKPAQIPYGVMLPRSVEGLLVPGALSATHLGFSVLRMEPPWMALGQAAGTAAHLALERGVPPSAIDVPELQRRLIDAGQVITFYYDAAGTDAVWTMLNKPEERTREDALIETKPRAADPCGIQYFGAKGFFRTYYARPADPLTRSEAVHWLHRFLELEGFDFAGTAEGGAAPAIELAGLPDGHPDKEKLRLLNRLGLIEGWQGTSGYYPGAAMSRADAVRAVAQAKRLTEGWTLPQEVRSLWSDLDAGHRDAAGFCLLAERGALPIGWSDRNQVHPLAYIARAEFCELLYRVMKR